MAHRELNHIAIATFFATVTVTAGADAVPHWLLVGSSDRTGGAGLVWVGAVFGFAFAFTALCMARGRKTTKMYAVPAELQI